MVLGGGVEEREWGEGRGGVVFEAFEREGCSFAASCLWEPSCCCREGAVG
jgi:hypothetical protein